YQAGLTESSLSTYVDLYCNGEYFGTYQLTEKVHINDDRVEINNLEDTTQEVNDQDLDTYPTFGPADANTAGNRKGYEIPNNPEDITGGYLLEFDHADRYAAEASGFVTKRGKPVVIKEPEYASREQVDYIANYFQEFEDAVYSADGICPTTGKHYYEYFDLSSLARKYIVEEITKNIDADITSQYYYKPSDTESTVGYCGPVWDYDNSMGNYNGTTDPVGMYAANRGFYKNLYKKESFLNAVYAEWETNFKPLLERAVNGETAPAGNVLRTFNEYYEMLAPSAAMNFTYWENINSVDTANYTDTGDTYEEHVEYLRNYLDVRTEYLSTVWDTDKIAISDPAIPEAPALDVALPSISAFNGHGSYAIATAEDLETLLELSKESSLKNNRFYLTANVDASEITASGGRFDGFLSGLYCTVSNLQVPLFKEVAPGATVEKLTVAGATCGSSLISVNRGTVQDVTLQDAVLRGKRVGGIADYNLGTIERCSVSGYLIGAAASGITAVNSGTVKACVNTAWIVSSAYGAGITARNQGTVDGCTNGGAIRGATRYAIANQGDTASQTLDRSMGEGTAAAKTNLELAESKALTIEQKSLLFGDANGDDTLDSADAVALLQALNGAQTLAETADCTFDGKATLADALHIIKTLGEQL
ncbi:MAG: CotH kinase family protein, partial [Clostridia bacterium]|nr:CotH kinase family protein [Clostridia bacterium]